MATLTALLDKLETIANPTAPQLLLCLLRQAGTESGGDDSITGIRSDGDRLPALKQAFVKEASGLSGELPRLLKGERV